MLVLTRKIGEKILIGDDITLTVVDIGQGRMKLGISAPPEHRILRSELVFDRQPIPPADMRSIHTGVAHTPRRRTAEPVGA